MYRQRTAASLAKGLGGDPTADQVAYQSLLSGWKDYLAHDNDGRPIIFIGHSQGAAMLIRLLRSQIDPNPRLRTQLVSAIILGGNVQVPKGKTVGGSFRHIPDMRVAASDGLRHRLFDLRDQAAFDVQFRSARAGGQPPIRPDRVGGSTGGVRQSGDVLVRPGAAPPVLPQRYVTCHRRDGAHSLGLFSGAVHGALREPGWRHVAPGDCRPGFRLTPAPSSRPRSAPIGAITPTTSIWPWATWCPTSPTRKRRIRGEGRPSPKVRR